MHCLFEDYHESSTGTEQGSSSIEVSDLYSNGTLSIISFSSRLPVSQSLVTPSLCIHASTYTPALFVDILTLEDETSRLSRRVGNQNPVTRGHTPPPPPKLILLLHPKILATFNVQWWVNFGKHTTLFSTGWVSRQGSRGFVWLHFKESLIPCEALDSARKQVIVFNLFILNHNIFSIDTTIVLI
jgi:hypothetical protein